MESPNSLGYIFLTSFAVAFSGAMMPGPMLTVTVREAARRGFWAGPLVVLGHGLLEAALVAGLFFGLANWLGSPLFLGVVGLAGGSVLVWMALSMLWELPRLSLALDAGGGVSTHPVVGGIVTSLTNPYFVLWWATVGLTWITLSFGRGWRGSVVFFTGHILADLAWYSFIAALLHFGRSLLTDRSYRWMVGTLALVLLYFGAGFVAGGFHRLTALP
jgi:threonine/homoserine/homoserine lactone efflux protein